MTLSSHRKRRTTRWNTAGGVEPRSALARWAGRGVLALLAASAGLAGFVVAEELLPEAGTTESTDPLARLKARSASERVAKLREQLASDHAAETRDLRDDATGSAASVEQPASEQSVANEPAGEVPLDEAAQVLDRIGEQDAAVPAVPEEPVTQAEAGSILDRLADDPSALPPAPRAERPVESGELPPVPTELSQDGSISTDEAGRILDQLADGGDLPDLTVPTSPDAASMPEATSPVESSTSAPDADGSNVPAPAEQQPAEVRSEPAPDAIPAAPAEGEVGEPTPEDELPSSPTPERPTPGRRARSFPASMRFVDDATSPDIEPVRDPSQLKKLGDILPYSDYEPDPEIAGTDRCQNLCPRPGDKFCPDCKPGMSEDPNQLSCPECPEEVTLNHGVAQTDALTRSFPANTYHWEAPNLWHYPRYFEDVDLERYGHSRPWYIQPFFSTARMSGQLLMGPYQMALLPPWKKEYVLGYYRPGRCVPYRYEQIPWNARAAAVQAGAVTGGYFLFAPTP